MRIVLAVVVGIAIGWIAGAWSARGEIHALRSANDELKGAVDRADRRKAASDLAMLAQVSQARRECDRPVAAGPGAPVPSVPTTPAPPPAAPVASAGDPVAPDAGVPWRLDRDAELARFAERAHLSGDQRDRIRAVAADFQRDIEEKIGALVTRFGVDALGGASLRPREGAEAADELLHAYLHADDRLQALLAPDQIAALDETRFDLLSQLDFASLERRVKPLGGGEGPE